MRTKMRDENRMLNLRRHRSSLPLAILGAVALLPLTAKAVDYTLCLRIPVDIEDESGESNEIGESTPTPGSGGWVGRGLAVTAFWDGGVDLLGFDHADSSGCFDVTVPGSPGTQDYQVDIQTYGSLADGNSLYVRGVANTLVQYSAVFELPGTSGTYQLYWPDEEELLTTYSILAYSINSGFRGRYDDETLRVWWNLSTGSSDCSCGHNCFNQINGNLREICLTEDTDRRKFVVGHEYGHVNLDGALNMSSKDDDCGYVATNDSSVTGHAIRSVEHDSCAFHEGWAQFVATDIWHSGLHSGGDPGGELVYIDDTHIDINGGMSTCWSSVDHTNTTNFPLQFGDDCRQDESKCSTGDCIAANVELDWMRALWDQHTDSTNYSGSRVGHTDLQDQIDDATSWSADEEAWTAILSGQIGSAATRLEAVGDAHGVSY